MKKIISAYEILLFTAEEYKNRKKYIQYLSQFVLVNLHGNFCKIEDSDSTEQSLVLSRCFFSWDRNKSKQRFKYSATPLCSIYCNYVDNMIESYEVYNYKAVFKIGSQ